jgi:hypothetical protein
MGLHLRQPNAPAGIGTSTSGTLTLTASLENPFGTVDDYIAVSGGYDTSGTQQGCAGSLVVCGAIQTASAPTSLSFSDSRFQTAWPTVPPSPRQFDFYQGTDWYFFISLINGAAPGATTITATLSGVPNGNIGAIVAYDYYSDALLTVTHPVTAASVNAAGPLALTLPGSILNGAAHFLVASSVSAVTLTSAGWVLDGANFSNLLSHGNGRFSTLSSAEFPYPEVAIAAAPASSVSFGWTGTQLVDVAVFVLSP